MEVELRLFASLRKYGDQRNKIVLPDGACVGDLLRQVGLPAAEVAILLVNGRHAKTQERLKDGDTVSLFPAIAGG